MCHEFYLQKECGHCWKSGITKCEEYIRSSSVGAGGECRKSGRCIRTHSVTTQQHPCFGCLFPDVFPQHSRLRICDPESYPSLKKEDIPTVRPSRIVFPPSQYERRSLQYLQEKFGDPMAITKEILKSERVRELARQTSFKDKFLNSEDLKWLGMVMQCLTYRIRKGLAENAFSDPESTYRKALCYAYINLDRKHYIAVLYRKSADRMDMRPPLCKPIQLNKLPEDAKKCHICLESFGQAGEDNEAEHAVQLPCKHVFGNRCIGNWVTDRKRLSCPACRFAFRKDEYILPGERNPHSYRDELERSSPAWMRRFRDGIFDPDEPSEEGWADYPDIP